jgi:mannosyltransferase PIG-V
MRFIRQTFLQWDWWQQVLFLLLASIILVHLAGLASTKILVSVIGWSDSTGVAPAGERVDSIEGRFARWDSGYYLQIARHGYRPGQAECSFFPLYPILIHTFSDIAGCSMLWSGLIVSSVSFLAAGLFLYQWVQIDYGSEVALWSIVWLAIFPMSFFFASIYTEALFLLTSLAAIYFARRGQFLLSGIAIALAGATRSPAFLLAIPYVLEFWKQHRFNWRQDLKFGLGGLVAPLGTLGYLIYISRQAGHSNLLAVSTSLHYGEYDRSFTYPWISLLDGIKAAFLGANINPDWFSRAIAWQDLTYAVLALVFALWTLHHARISIRMFMVASIIFLFANHGPQGYAFFSLPRYIAALFPIYPILAWLTLRLNNRFRFVLVTFSIALLGILAAWFVTGRWVA